MKIKEVTFAIKKGLPNYSSVFASVTVTVEEGENVSDAWDMAKAQALKQCDTDPSFMNEKQPNERR